MIPVNVAKLIATGEPEKIGGGTVNGSRTFPSYTGFSEAGQLQIEARITGTPSEPVISIEGSSDSGDSWTEIASFEDAGIADHGLYAITVNSPTDAIRVVATGTIKELEINVRATTGPGVGGGTTPDLAAVLAEGAAAGGTDITGLGEGSLSTANLPTDDEKAALDAAASPTGENAFATIADLPDTANLPSADEKAALDAAASPTGENAFATIADLPDVTGLPSSDEKAALDAAASPTGENPFATIADLGGGSLPDPGDTDDVLIVKDAAWGSGSVLGTKATAGDASLVFTSVGHGIRENGRIVGIEAVNDTAELSVSVLPVEGGDAVVVMLATDGLDGTSTLSEIIAAIRASEAASALVTVELAEGASGDTVYPLSAPDVGDPGASVYAFAGAIDGPASPAPIRWQTFNTGEGGVSVPGDGTGVPMPWVNAGDEGADDFLSLTDPTNPAVKETGRYTIAVSIQATGGTPGAHRLFVFLIAGTGPQALSLDTDVDSATSGSSIPPFTLTLKAGDMVNIQVQQTSGDAITYTTRILVDKLGS